ncbi:hypothetical protein NEF87_004733 [Candidatus Lokiarchaeum ossiferum]|uniref:Uncharacterized protein n=1 Tax=Candidatus Lokiarchaeum ossiferum TaxID=2951803 RepID=A0ABY6HY50_9ARCH|nr:hypothetical protein NEF87_004733 [Candidatus Lokiarchaeum sp. B-35]
MKYWKIVLLVGVVIFVAGLTYVGIVLNNSSQI